MPIPIRNVLLLAALLVPLALAGCAGSGGGGGGNSSQAAAAADTPPPAGSPLARIETGMNDTQVRAILGEPDNANAYMTGKAWIPYYYGSDTSRTDWMYKGLGRVVFSRNRYSGGLKVIRVIYDPDELK